MEFRRLSSSERRSVGMARMLHRYTLEPPGAPIERSQVFTRRAMILFALAREKERREELLPKGIPSKPKREHKPYPRGFKVIDGKRVYPKQPKQAEVIPEPPKQPSMRQVSLDEGLPPSHPRTTPVFNAINQGPSQQQLIDQARREREAKPQFDFDVMAASLSKVVANVDYLKKRIDEIETKQIAPDSIEPILLTIRAQCVARAFGTDSEVNKFARSLVDLIDSLAPKVVENKHGSRSEQSTAGPFPRQ